MSTSKRNPYPWRQSRHPIYDEWVSMWVRIEGDGILDFSRLLSIATYVVVSHTNKHAPVRLFDHDEDGDAEMNQTAAMRFPVVWKWRSTLFERSKNNETREHNDDGHDVLRLPSTRTTQDEGGERERYPSHNRNYESKN